jgi:hypothetical protein
MNVVFVSALPTPETWVGCESDSDDGLCHLHVVQLLTHPSISTLHPEATHDHTLIHGTEDDLQMHCHSMFSGALVCKHEANLRLPETLSHKTLIGDFRIKFSTRRSHALLWNGQTQYLRISR